MIFYFIKWTIKVAPPETNPGITTGNNLKTGYSLISKDSFEKEAEYWLTFEKVQVVEEITEEQDILFFQNMLNLESKTLKTCSTCIYWSKIPDNEFQKDMGSCSMLSRDNKSTETCDVNKTGIEAYPICAHDGMAVTYETKSWFGCINHSIK